MKIYNKKKFADGCFFLVLGAALAGAMIWKREIDGKSVVLALIALVIGADALVRSLPRRPGQPGVRAGVRRDDGRIRRAVHPLPVH